MQHKIRTTFITTTFFLVFACTLTPRIFAQGGPPDLLQRFTSPVMKEAQKIQGRIMFRSLWDGSGTSSMVFAMVLDNAEYRQLLGVSPEQLEQIKAASRAAGANPEFVAAMQEVQNLTNPSDPFFLNASDDTAKSYLDATEKMTRIMTQVMPQEMDKVVTPEQRRRMQEFEIASMGFMPFINPEMFEALDLTEEQRQQIEAIKKELEPEFDRIADELTEAQFAAMDAVYEQMKADGVTITNFGEMNKKIDDAIKRLEAKSGKDYRMTAEKKVEAARDFVKKFKFKMFDVLTDAQMKKMWDLTHKPPQYMQTVLAKLKKSYEERSKMASWRPGANSWQPGDPIPQEYIEHRKARFPKR